MQPWDPRAKDRWHQHRSPTQRWCLQTRPRALHDRTTASPMRTMSGHGSTSSKCHGFREAGEAQKLGRGKLFPATHVICSYLHFRSKILEVESKASAQQKTVARISTRQLCLPTMGAALCKEQTQTDGAQDKVAMPGQTDLYLTAAAVTACGRRRGGSTHSPQKCTQLGKKRCFLQLSKRNQELIP